MGMDFCRRAVEIYAVRNLELNAAFARRSHEADRAVFFDPESGQRIV